MLTMDALRRWLPPMARRLPNLASAYLVPGRVEPRLREATMLGVTSVNRCRACERVHERWGRAAGLPIDGPQGFEPDEVGAWAYGQSLAMDGPGASTPPVGLSRRHRRELEAAAFAMELANLTGNRCLPDWGSDAGPGVAAAWAAGMYDLGMRVADRAGLRRARARLAAGVTGDILEIGIGTGLNLKVYPPGTSLQAIDPSAAALAVAADRAERIGHQVTLTAGDAADMPYADDSFDVVVGAFVLCTVGDVASTLRECRRVLRPGGTLRFLEHGRSDHAVIARSQSWLAPAWARVAGGCRLDHDVRASIEAADLRLVSERSRGSGLLVEIVAASG